MPAEMLAEIVDEIADHEPFAPFARWLEAAMRSEPLAETIMLATATRDGVPSERAVLLKGADAEGLVFYTNLESRKAEELRENPRAALCFHWKSLGRQIRIQGQVASAGADEADAYFATRVRDSQIGAWASAQSRPMEGRACRYCAIANMPPAKECQSGVVLIGQFRSFTASRAMPP